MRFPAFSGFILAGALAITTATIAQGRAESKPLRVAESRPKEPGSAELLKRLLGEYAEARAKRTPEALARADEIDRTLPDRDWSRVEIAGTAFEFVVVQEQKTRDNRIEGWDFDRLPPTLVWITTVQKWACFVEQRIDALAARSGPISWKGPKAWKAMSSEMVQARAFEKIASIVSTGLARKLDEIPPQDIARFHEAFFRVYAEYDIETVHKSTAYSHLPAGLYMQWGGWLGDRRAMKVASDMVDAWLAAPRETQVPNFDQAVRTIDLFNNLLRPDQEAERVGLIRKIKADPKTPDSVKAIIKTP
jgi:hypothetical protein